MPSRVSSGIMQLATDETYHHGYARRDRAAEYQREVLAFQLAREEYALDILRIREILKMRSITDVPRAPTFVLGIVALRGQVIPVINLRLRLRMPSTPVGKDTRILIVTRDGEQFGLIVDAVNQVVRMRDEEIEPPPPMIGGVESEFVSGIGRPRADRLLILLNLDAVVNFSVGGRK
ncbi:MAG: chemotaxis protein CheW [Deltaproteobacteria bacterium]|nr:chemotaxis protein CheW [Deltaproteobacteria bacterium]